MHIALEILTIMLTAVTMSLALAHALEFPGKLRLSMEEYLTVQAIYYPGFTFGGFAEFGSIIAALALLLLTPTRGARGSGQTSDLIQRCVLLSRHSSACGGGTFRRMQAFRDSRPGPSRGRRSGRLS